MRGAKSVVEDADTVVIGAGAAGLAAASKLASEKQRVAILEARDRVGGRIFTQRRTPAPIPVELGAEFVHGAMDSLRAIFGSRMNYASLLESVSWHDWQRDPFSYGAYSYLLARAASARRSLAAALNDTLFFAGEASDTEDEAGTVGGALQSGTRAARQVLESMSGSRRRTRRKG